jgi:hypothetical protein
MQAPVTLGGTPMPPVARALRLAGVGAALVVLGRAGVLCPMAAVTGHPCPGCGLTRATLALLHGHVSEAMGFHPLAPLVSPILLGFFAYGSLVYVRSGRWPATEGRAGARVAGAGVALWVLLLVVWIARFYGAFGGPVTV